MSLSKETQALLASMMDNTKLTEFQKRQLKAAAKTGTALPKTVHPSSSKPRQARTASTSSSSSTTTSSRTRSGRLKVDQIQKRKPLDKIVHDSNPQMRPEYKVKPGADRAAMREELGDIMTYGKDVVEKKREIRKYQAQRLETARMTGHVTRHANTESRGRCQGGNMEGRLGGGRDVDLFDVIVDEIDERQKFLEELQQGPHSPEQVANVRTEIAQRIRQLELIDRKKTQERLATQARIRKANTSL